MVSRHMMFFTEFHTEEIKIYEEVTQTVPDFDKPRPIIILGSFISIRTIV